MIPSTMAFDDACQPCGGDFAVTITQDHLAIEHESDIVGGMASLENNLACVMTIMTNMPK